MSRISSYGQRAGVVSLSLYILCAVLAADAKGADLGATKAQTRGIVVIKDTAGSELELYKESHALVIGVSDYTEGWPPLPGVKEDIQAVTQALEKSGFQVVTVENPDHGALQKAYRDFLRSYGLVADNRLLFYFAGHGYTHKPSYATNDPEEWMGYIVPRDAPLPTQDFAAFMGHAVSMHEFDALAQQIEAKHALFVFDSCFSGSIFALSRAAPLNISLLTVQPVRQFISSGSADQEVPDKSAFRRQFIAALDGEADRNHDGYVTGSELGLFLYEKVTNYSRGTQTPQYGKIRHPRLDKGDFVFPLTLANVPPGPPLPQAQAQGARGELRESSPPPPLLLRGNLQVNVNVKEAKVSVNGASAGTAQPDAPLNVHDLGAGLIRVRVEAEEYEPLEREVHIEVDQWAQEAFILKPLPVAQKTTAVSLQTGTGTPPAVQFVPPEQGGAAAKPAPRPAAKPVAPGRYEVTKATPLLAAPDDKAAVLQQLNPHTTVNVVGTEGDYLKIESKAGKPPGYVSRKAVTPSRAVKAVAREEPAAPLPVSSTAARKTVATPQAEQQLQIEQERQHQEELRQQQELMRNGEQLLRGLIGR
ncbi:MAG TPA: caspase family protein [Candidatus Binatia bacterium]|jgi:hypothetical protein|nr:caspase family protein [Candidatus Binatia bacterium]